MTNRKSKTKSVYNKLADAIVNYKNVRAQVPIAEDELAEIDRLLASLPADEQTSADQSIDAFFDAIEKAYLILDGLVKWAEKRDSDSNA